MDKAKMLEVIKPYVKSQLKAPVSAVFCEPDELIVNAHEDSSDSFQSLEDELKRYKELLNQGVIDGGSYTVEGYVSSQNTYGAMIKNDFICELKTNGKSYEVVSCNVGAKTRAADNLNFVRNFIAISIFTGIAGLIGYYILKMIRIL